MIDLPLYRLQLEDDTDGIYTISFVKSPAIEANFVAFSKQDSIKFSSSDEKLRIVTGPALIPDLPIYRRDTSGYEYNVFANREDIFKFGTDAIKKGSLGKVNIEHKGELITGVDVIEFWFVDSRRGRGDDVYPDGTLMLSYKVYSDDTWNRIESKEIEGFSIEGMFSHVVVNATKEVKPKSLRQEYEDLLKMFGA